MKKHCIWMLPTFSLFAIWVVSHFCMFLANVCIKDTYFTDTVLHGGAIQSYSFWYPEFIRNGSTEIDFESRWGDRMKFSESFIKEIPSISYSPAGGQSELEFTLPLWMLIPIFPIAYFVTLRSKGDKSPQQSDGGSVMTDNIDSQE